MKKIFTLSTVVVFLGVLATTAYASHTWGNYHWARTSTPFVLKLGDKVSGVWDSHLATSSAEWNASTVLETVIVPSLAADPRTCKPSLGRVEVCNTKYGKTGWLGIASIWATGEHITQGTVKLNDTYFATATYNTPAWRNLVMCQEIAHTFGLGHQDEIFNNANLGTCMDYTNDPSGALYGQLSNEYPNTHDYVQLETIYTHLDTITTLGSKLLGLPARKGSVREDIDTTNSSEWGREIKRSSDGKSSLHERELGNGTKVFTFVIWAE
ncbi:MAG: hypothetical protein AAB552_03435 [Patescibacteria group bacterium]